MVLLRQSLIISELFQNPGFSLTTPVTILPHNEASSLNDIIMRGRIGVNQDEEKVAEYELLTMSAFSQDA